MLRLPGLTHQLTSFFPPFRLLRPPAAQKEATFARMEGGGGGGGDPGAYAARLKRNLDLYCAAVAKSMESKSQESSFGYLDSQASDTSQLGCQASFNGYGPTRITNSGVIYDDDDQCKPDNSGTSKEHSDDDGDIEENADPANAKRMRRMLSNRESARRSRKRRQTHLNDLESQVSQLRSENASLLKRLADMTQKYKLSTTENSSLQADMDTMRRKV
ncbi:hypothetical protein GUJ93_ZPchr0009g666 [Zizania palustris]|uniref:BZIP domain-containing protein n=1 Tax=Zizania palustris TaxID=103762 RepID=A0A8J5RHC1_ZIZPA|nr:hypothetical protein GUJ93_ZPchr0009g666 [Zizania palustris]